MEQKPSCSPVSEPKDMHWDSIDFSKFILLFGVGSFALDGPVLLALGFLGDKEAENNTLVHLRLTPFNQEAKLIGSFNDRSFFQTDEVFSLFNHLGTQYPPSLLLGSTVFEEHFIQTFFTRYFQWRNDGFGLLKAVHKTPFMSGMRNGHLYQAMMKGSYPPEDERPLSEDEAAFLAGHLLKEKCVDYEYKGFLMLWMDLDTLEERMGKKATMDAYSFGSFFTHIERSSRFKRGALLRQLR